MSIHIGAKEGDIASTILLPGDPLRAKYIAENFLTDTICYNEIRGMYGYTGIYKEKKVSIQGTGMGIPSISIYLNELITSYKAKNLIRIGSCGSMQADIKIRDVILAMSASTNSHINKIRFNGMDYAPTADFNLLKKAYDIALEKNISVKIGSVLTSDTFYQDDPNSWKHWANYGVLAVEMETAALYSLAAKFKVNARQKTFNQMVEVALELVE
jgi:purine-nucleoside phosphorylase